MLNEKLKPEHNETLLSLQYCKLSRKSEQSVKEWMEYK